MKSIIFSALVFGLSFVNGFPTKTTEDYLFSETLVEGSYILYWKHNETHITLETHVRTLGWIGFGISDNGNMYPADVVIGWVKDGKAFLEDRYAMQYDEPMKDRNENWHLLFGSESNGVTVLKFVRALDTCDTEGDKIITRDFMHVIYAWNDADPNPRPLKHTTKGTSVMYLLDPITREIAMPSDAKYFMFTSLKTEIPPQLTFYQCTTYIVPTLERKHHAIAFEPHIQPGNEDIVHHFVLMTCSVPFPEADNGTTYDCNAPPKQFETCYTVYYAWAVGGKTFYLPNNVGQTIGDASGPRYYVFEVHYNNVKLEAGRVDSSGLRVVYTPTLREFDLGMLQMGVQVTPAHVIPPHYNEFISRGYCTSDCLSQGTTDGEPMYITAVLLHSHLLGRKLRLRHIRDGVELKPISVDNNYDFDFQQTRQLRVPVMVKPTDTLLMECVYDSSGRINATRGGLGTDEEMCLAFISFYPESAGITTCFSTPTYNAGKDITSVSRESYRLVAANDWKNGLDRHQFQCLVDRTDHYFLCEASGNWKLLFKPVPKIVKPYVAESKCPRKPETSVYYGDYCNPSTSGSSATDLQTTMIFIMTSLIYIYA